MLDIETLLSYPVATRGLVADLPQLREPCTCGAGLPTCPACIAWSERYLSTFQERLALATTRFTPPSTVDACSPEDLAALRRQIVGDAAVVRMLDKRCKRQGGVLRADDQELHDTLTGYLRTNRAFRKAVIDASKKGRFYGKRRLD